jgi:hypothetical protein
MREIVDAHATSVGRGHGSAGPQPRLQTPATPRGEVLIDPLDLNGTRDGDAQTVLSDIISASLSPSDQDKSPVNTRP